MDSPPYTQILRISLPWTCIGNNDSMGLTYFGKNSEILVRILKHGHRHCKIDHHSVELTGRIGVLRGIDNP
jgi:hypothetical protein